MTTPTNLFADLPKSLPDELITTLVASENIRIERIVRWATLRPRDSGSTRISTNGSFCWPAPRS